MKVLSAVGMRQVLLALEPRLEHATGTKVEVEFDSFGVIVKRIAAGEPFDVVVVPRAGIERLISEGKLLPGSGADLASSVAGVAVRSGAPKPDISSVDAFRNALLAAKSIARPDPAKGGSSGLSIARMLEKLGIAEEVEAKSVLASRPEDERGMPGHFVADGRAEMALHQMQELMAVPGIEVVGPFPAEIRETFVFSAGVTTSTRQAAAARALIELLRTDEARKIMVVKGMDPASR